LSRQGGFQRLPGGRKNLFWRDVAHAAVVDRRRLMSEIGSSFHAG
jgi:hypothetical protein